MAKNKIVPGTLYIIAAPSGAGKTSLVNALVKTLNNVEISISHTTRPARPGEQDGVHYWFVNQAEFQRMIDDQIFLEYATVFGYYYGTSRHWVEEKINQGVDVILEIDWQGARQVRQQFSNTIGVFILPPSRELLRERLLARQQDHATVIEQRLAAASQEIKHYYEFDYLIINNIFDLALADLQTIVRANRLSQKKQAIKYANVVANLLQN